MITRDIRLAETRAEQLKTALGSVELFDTKSRRFLLGYRHCVEPTFGRPPDMMQLADLSTPQAGYLFALYRKALEECEQSQERRPAPTA